jgi:photosystem II stability/assembly factor-like uncharacterized protein
MDTGIGTNGSEFTSVPCPAVTVCYPVSEAYGLDWTGGSIYRTRGAGRYWARTSNHADSTARSEDLLGIACSDTRSCYVVGGFPWAASGSSYSILHTLDGGSHRVDVRQASTNDLRQSAGAKGSGQYSIIRQMRPSRIS